MTDKSEQDQDPPLTTKDEESMSMKVSDSTVDHAPSDNGPAAIGCSLFCFIANSLMCMGCMWF